MFSRYRCCMEEGFTQSALSRARIPHRALIIVGLEVLADVDPECTLRMLFCEFSQWPVANKLPRPSHAISDGGSCKRTGMRGVILQRVCRVGAGRRNQWMATDEGDRI